MLGTHKVEVHYRLRALGSSDWKSSTTNYTHSVTLTVPRQNITRLPVTCTRTIASQMEFSLNQSSSAQLLKFIARIINTFIMSSRTGS